MVQGNATRRKFLVASIAFSGLISTGMGAALLRAGSAWAQSSGGNADELARMARLLFPHDGIADDVYAEVIDSILTDSANDASMMELLDAAVPALNAAQGGDWFEAGEDAQIAAMKSVENEAFFAAIHGNVQARIYSHPKVWELIKFPGSSVEFGGYVDRGFDDIDWLPEDA
jgi:hypothetical protein